MKLFNTKTRTLEEFNPIDPQNIKIYTCGPTVYSPAHIGNFTAYIYWDTLIRLLHLHDWQVQRILNITDVGHLSSDADTGEDKLESGAKRENKSVWEIAELYTVDFLKNFQALGLIPPTKIAKASDYIKTSIELIDTLTQKNYTYEYSDGIYFDTAKFPNYANFAHLDLAHLKAGARVHFNHAKRNLTDFALWKFIQDGEDHAMQWDYLGKKGYPGWHIECSSIIHQELGETIDIHTGGIDHIPIHHSNEIAQSEAAYDKPLANFWLHNNFISIDGQKISKSLGNTYTFEDLAQRGFSHLDYRMWVLQGHYQSERNFSFSDLAAAKQRLLKYRNFAALRHQNSSKQVSWDENELSTHIDELLTLAGNNINTPAVLSKLDAIISAKRSPHDKLLAFYDKILGLNLISSTPDLNPLQETLIAKRQNYKKQQDYLAADQIRSQLAEQNITLLDGINDTVIWQYAK